MMDEGAVGEATSNTMEKKKYRTDSGTAITTPEGVMFNNSGEKDKFTWDEINAMNAGKRVRGFRLDKRNSTSNNLVYHYPGMIEHHLPRKALSATLEETSEDLAEGFKEMDKYLQDKEKGKGTGKFEKTNTDKGTKYTKKYDPDAEENDDEDEDKDSKKNGGRKVGSKSGARHRYKKIDENQTGIEKLIASAYGSELFESEVEEELKGGQKKLDKNHNGELDAEDFKMLRSKKKVKEDAKPDFLDVDDDGNKKESFKKALKDKELKEGGGVDGDEGNDGYCDSCDRPSKECICDDKVEEGKSCNHTMEGKECPVHGEKDCSEDKVNESLTVFKKLAGLKECGEMSPMGSTAGSQEGRINISTNASSDGEKNVTITANGDTAVALMQILKLAGMPHGDMPASAEPEIEIVDVDSDAEEEVYDVADEEVDEESIPGELVGNGTDPQVLPVQSLTKGGTGEVAGKEKRMHKHGYKFADNPMAMMENSLQLIKEYNSIKIKK
jgi:hypothetical protein